MHTLIRLGMLLLVFMTFGCESKQSSSPKLTEFRQYWSTKNDENSVEGYLAKSKFLKNYDPASYQKMVTKGGSIYLKKGVAIFELEEVINEAFPLKSLGDAERESATKACLMAIVFESTLKNGGSEKDLDKAYKSVVSLF